MTTQSVTPGDDYFKNIATNGSSTGDMPTLEQMQEIIREGQKINERYHDDVAAAFLAGGITLIPNEHLRDHEYMVSPAIYKAAQKLANERNQR